MIATWSEVLLKRMDRGLTDFNMKCNRPTSLKKNSNERYIGKYTL